MTKYDRLIIAVEYEFDKIFFYLISNVFHRVRVKTKDLE